MTRRLLMTTLSMLCAALVLLVAAGSALAETTASASAPESPTSTSETTTVPAPQTPASSESSTSTSAAPAPGETTNTTTETTPTTTTSAAPETPGSSQTATVPAPEVRTQRSQPRTIVAHPQRKASTTKQTKSKGKPSTGQTAVSPSELTPPLPSSLSGLLSGVPSFFINSFSIPPFLLPIYQAAGAAYGIPWQVLAAINEVETDYGRDLSVSSAGAEGWMQFLPNEWGQYGVDVNDDGFEDPYNPADAIFAAARYLKKAGGDTDIRAAVFSYNHSQAYVNSVLLRARLLAGTPPELLGALTGLTEARFPVYAASHYSDGFPTTEGPSPHTVAGTTIYSQDEAPVIAVQDGRIVRIEQAGPLGRSITLQDTYGNTYTYAELGSLATLYPVLEASEPGAGGALAASDGATREFKAGPENVYLHPLRVGVHVIAGTVLGHVGPGAEPHMVFQIRPSGAKTLLIDPKPILDGWVKLQSSSAIKAKGRDPFAKITPSPGQALLESKTQLELQIPRDHGMHLARCERRLIADGRVDRRVLAVLEFLAASGLNPTVSSRSCAQTPANDFQTSSIGSAQQSVDISAANGNPVASQHGPTSVATVIAHKLAGLQGVVKPLQIASSTRFAGAPGSVALPGYTGLIHVAFAQSGIAHAAALSSSGLTPAQWLQLTARLGEVPDPAVSSKPSSAAIPDSPNTAAEGGK